MITGFERECTFEHFGLNTHRDASRCPHCGRRGNVADEADVFWNDCLKARDDVYECPTCKGEWIIRRYINTGYEKYPATPYACIYIPMEKTR